MAKDIKELYAAVNSLPEAGRDYALRFVSKNYALPLADFSAKWEQDQADREGAAKLQRHREEKVIGEFQEIMKGRGVEVLLDGIAVGSASTPPTV